MKRYQSRFQAGPSGRRDLDADQGSPSPVASWTFLNSRTFQLSYLPLGWKLSELHFHDLVYIIFCLASAESCTIELVDSRDLGERGEGRTLRPKGLDSEATTEVFCLFSGERSP